MWKLVRYSLHWSSYVAFWVEIRCQEISGILRANNSVDNLCRWVLVHFRFIIMAFNQSQQFDGLFSISAPIGHKQAKNAILFCRKPQYFEIARLFENISGQPPFRLKNIITLSLSEVFWSSMNNKIELSYEFWIWRYSFSFQKNVLEEVIWIVVRCRLLSWRGLQRPMGNLRN